MNIQEDLFQAIDTIVEKRMKEISFDTTVVCKVLQKTSEIEYMVEQSNGSSFLAYAFAGASYKENDEVYVMIPKDNYNIKRIILGMVNENLVPEKSAILPFGDLQIINSYKQDVNLTIGPSPLLTTVASGIDVLQNINTTLKGNKYFGVRAIFETYMSNTMSGNYGLLIRVNGKEYGQFDSYEFCGNPYNYEGGFAVEKLFPFPKDGGIVEVQLYCKDNFEPWPGQQADEIKITLKSLEVAMGMDEVLNEENDEVIRNGAALNLYLNDGEILQYSADKEGPIATRNIRALFYENGIFYKQFKEKQAVTDNDIETIEDEEEEKEVLLPANYQLRWFYFQPNCKDYIKLVGAHWKEDATVVDEAVYAYRFDTDTSGRQVKAIIFNTETEEIVAEAELAFLNIDEKKTDKPDNALSLSINNNPYHAGTFNLYSSDNQFRGDITSFTLSADFAGASKLNECDSVTWILPNSDSGLITYNKDDLNSPTITLNIDTSQEKTPSNSDFTIKCQVTRSNGITYEVEKTIHFGEKETQGTNYSLNLLVAGAIDAQGNLDSSYQYFKLQKDKYEKIQLQCVLINQKTKAIIPLDSANGYEIKWKWEYANKDRPENSIGDNVFYEPADSISSVNLELIDSAKVNYASIVVEVANSKENLQLKTKQPILVINNSDISPSISIDGATSIFYKQLGGYNATDAAYRLQGYKGIVNWLLNYENTDAQNFISINSSNKLSFQGTLVPGGVSIVAKDKNGVTICSQPIKFEQEAYGSSILNEWDGTLTINEEQNYILSEMIGAGTKNADNTFTGVFMGAVGKDIAGAKTGFYGFKNGVQRFSLTEDGEMTIGTVAKNSSYIAFQPDGSLKINLSSDSKESDFELSSDIMTFNTKQFIIKEKSSNAVVFQADDKGVVMAGWNVTANAMSKGGFIITPNNIGIEDNPVFKVGDVLSIMGNGDLIVGPWSIQTSTKGPGSQYYSSGSLTLKHEEEMMTTYITFDSYGIHRQMFTEDMGTGTTQWVHYFASWENLVTGDWVPHYTREKGDKQ